MDEASHTKWLLATLGFLGNFLFGGWSLPLKILIACIVIDYITGMLRAFVRKELSSEVGAHGIAKKVGIMALVSLAHLIDLLFQFEAPILQTLVTWFYIGNEGISIAENVADTNVPIPRVLREALAIVRSRGEKDRWQPTEARDSSEPLR